MRIVLEPHKPQHVIRSVGLLESVPAATESEAGCPGQGTHTHTRTRQLRASNQPGLHVIGLCEETGICVENTQSLIRIRKYILFFSFFPF